MPSTVLPAVPAPLLRGPLHADEDHPGCVALGPTPDGAGHARYPLATPRRMRHGVIVGDPGTGVGNLTTVLAVTARATMPLVTAYINGCPRLTNPALAHQSTVLLDGAEVADVARTALAALQRAVAARAALLADLRASSYPAAGLPALLVLIAGAHHVFDGHGERWAAVLRQAGTLGIGVVATVPALTLSSFGGSSTLRSLLLAQLVALRSSCPITHDLAAAPAETPTGVGRLIVGGEHVQFVSFRLSAGGTHALAERGRRRWLVAYPDTGLDGPTREAFGRLVHRGAA
ncbi:hypothetical protein [Prauserella muralis]|uniref:Uncharacterized protein n=1 Tax=Prauserella muralis TaxID=588067 RepID=A0A2V4ABS9_9PSEU|nr:hypothetical protein [Prauserella muralis]PXY16572.1 hypothetical protein BAY60_35840 [Prauserella muralis]TWE11188.1 hypothetical protein FHX69_7407 [Prauserella muralis]